MPARSLRISLVLRFTPSFLRLMCVQGSGSKSNEELASLAAFTLLQQYTQHAPSTKGLVQKLLAAQGIHT